MGNICESNISYLKELKSYKHFINLDAFEICERELEKRSRFAILRSCEILSLNAQIELKNLFQNAMAKCLAEIKEHKTLKKTQSIIPANITNQLKLCESKVSKSARFSILTNSQELSKNARKELERDFNLSQWIWKAQRKPKEQKKREISISRYNNTKYISK